MECKVIKLTDDIINEVNRFNSSEELLRSGGLSTETLDRAAFGFSDEDVKTLSPDNLKIKWLADLENVKYEILHRGLTPKAWATKVDLSEPIDVSYEGSGKKRGFYIEDGHHRYYAAKILNKPLNVNLTINANPIIALGYENYDNFHRCVFNQVKSLSISETTIKIKKLLREGLINKKKYIGQCDRLRGQCDNNEQYWQEMMKLAKPISIKEFISKVDMSPMLDDGETAESYINDAIRTDNESGTYISMWGDKPCMFFQTAGFEFIFV